MKVLFLPEVSDYFLDLAIILYEKEYFGFFNSSVKYADELFEEIKNNLPNKAKKNAPKYFDRYGIGMQYSIF